jgi:branched-chain amino acid transport system substrate-binding protein
VSHRAVLLSLLMLGACAPSRDPYTIGSAGPWKLRHGRNTRLGIQLAVREINAAGGINGHPLVVREVDDEADGRKAAQVAQAFVDNATISAVVGHVTSGAMVSAAKVYDGHLAAMATSASSPDLTGISPWVFRVISSDSANGVDMARFANRTGHKRVAILYENDNYGRGLADAFRRSFAGEIVSVDPIPAEARNAEVYISYFKLRQPDLVFVAGFEASGVAILTEARRQGLQADFMGGDGWTTLTAHVDVAEGAYVGAPFTPTDPRPTARRFVAAFKRAYHGTEPDGNAALGYDAVRLLAAALAAVGPDRTKIRDWLSSPASSLDGATGPIRFQPSGDPLGKSVMMTRIARDGTLAIAGGTP